MVRARLGAPGSGVPATAPYPPRMRHARMAPCCDGGRATVRSYEILTAVAGRALIVTAYTAGVASPAQRARIDARLARLVVLTPRGASARIGWR